MHLTFFRVLSQPFSLLVPHVLLWSKKEQHATAENTLNLNLEGPAVCHLPPFTEPQFPHLKHDSVELHVLLALLPIILRDIRIPVLTDELEVQRADMIHFKSHT